MELDRARVLVEGCLRVLDARFSDSVVKVGTSTCNASRICKLYGTRARKGDPTPERPHRVASILEEPEKLTPVPLEALEALDAEADADRSHSTANREQKVGSRSSHHLNLQQWINEHGLDVEPPLPWKGGTRWIFPICPWNSEHRYRSAYIVQFANGAIAAGCHHNGCRGRDWQALRDLLEPGWRTQRGQDNPELPCNPEWETPIPFDQFNLPPFPTEVFPGWLRAFVEAEATATQTPLILYPCWRFPSSPPPVRREFVSKSSQVIKSRSTYLPSQRYPPRQ